MKKLLIGAAALITAAAPIAASAAPFHGGRTAAVAYHNGWRGDHRGGNGGAALAAGLFGLVVGAAIASSDRPDYAAPSYGYGYGDCGWRTEAVRGPYGRIHYEQVQVCD
ncbi:MAG TPA: hypothetical protein VGG29_11740 [Caulobacteraceae bacterium]|jgi:hypothetical protein